MWTWNSRGRALLAALPLMAIAGCSPKPGVAPPADARAAGDGSGGLSRPSVVAPAAAPGDGLATFTEPTENAFTVSAPAGWRVTGGVKRTSAFAARPWARATSPDGSTTVFINDPALPIFSLPDQQHGQGSVYDTAYGPQTALGYQSGGQFAASYVERARPCAGLQPTATRPEAEVARQAQARVEADNARTGSGVPVQTEFDAGSAVFSCQVDGKPYVAGAVAATALTRFGQGGIWTVPTLFGYRGPADRQGEADRVVRAMQASFRADPRWQEALDAAVRQQVARIRDQGARNMRQMQVQADQNSALSRERGEAFAAAQQGRHQAYMNQMNAQGDARNAAFAEQQDRKDVNHQAEMRYIRNQTCAVWWDASHSHCRYTVGN